MPVYGLIYVARNERDGANVFKVGKSTRSVDERMRELTSDTSNLGEYVAHTHYVVTDVDLAEREAHRSLNFCRVQPNREFFEIPFSELIPILNDALSSFVIAHDPPALSTPLDYSNVPRSLRTWVENFEATSCSVKFLTEYEFGVFARNLSPSEAAKIVPDTGFTGPTYSACSLKRSLKFLSTAFLLTVIPGWVAAVLFTLGIVAGGSMGFLVAGLSVQLLWGLWLFLRILTQRN